MMSVRYTHLMNTPSLVHRQDLVICVMDSTTGREAEAAFNISEKGAGGTYTYTFSKGVFGGISLETAIMNVRSKENESFYGKTAKAKEILWDGAVEIPPGKGIEEVS